MSSDKNENLKLPLDLITNQINLDTAVNQNLGPEMKTVIL